MKNILRTKRYLSSSCTKGKRRQNANTVSAQIDKIFLPCMYILYIEQWSERKESAYTSAGKNQENIYLLWPVCHAKNLQLKRVSVSGIDGKRSFITDTGHGTHKHIDIHNGASASSSRLVGVVLFYFSSFWIHCVSALVSYQRSPLIYDIDSTLMTKLLLGLFPSVFNQFILPCCEVISRPSNSGNFSFTKPLTILFLSFGFPHPTIWW